MKQRSGFEKMLHAAKGSLDFPEAAIGSRDIGGI